MKKNNTMRVAAGLAVAALLSTCLVSGTYAKYTTSKSSSDEARVAKWGVTVTGNKTAFSSVYDQADGATVKSSNGTDKVVAPGTKGTMAAATVSGTPEVAVKVTNEATVTLTGWTYTDETGEHFYCPLTFKVNGAAVDTSKCTDVAGVKKAVEDAVKATSKDYGPNKAITDADAAEIDWEWAYDANEGANDVKDTALGDATTPSTVKIEVATTVTQID